MPKNIKNAVFESKVSDLNGASFEGCDMSGIQLPM